MIIGNLKMNPESLTEFDVYARLILEHKKKETESVSIGLAIPFPFLERARLIFKEDILVGAQDVSFEKKGSFTGDVSASMVKSLGVSFVLVGHSERKKFHNETSHDIVQKCARVLEQDLVLVLCIGETLEEKQIGVTKNILRKQLEDIFPLIKKEEVSRLILAYEPVWAVGTDAIPSPDELRSVVEVIRELCGECLGEDARNIHILYGGSVHSQNIGSVLRNTGLDGILVGRSSLDVEEFFLIAKEFSKEKKS